jgi:hypothetical protein
MRGTSRRAYRKALTRIRYAARHGLKYHAASGEHPDEDVAYALTSILEITTLALDGKPGGHLCHSCERAEPTVHKILCVPCWEKVKADFREAWKDAPPMTEQEFEELVLSFFVWEPDEEGETNEP